MFSEFREGKDWCEGGFWLMLFGISWILGLAIFPIVTYRNNGILNNLGYIIGALGVITFVIGMGKYKANEKKHRYNEGLTPEDIHNVDS